MRVRGQREACGSSKFAIPRTSRDNLVDLCMSVDQFLHNNQMSVVRWQQDKNKKEARENTEGKFGRVHWGK